MQVCISLQTDNHARTPPLSFFKGQMPFLPPNQQRQSTEGKIRRTETTKNISIILLLLFLLLFVVSKGMRAVKLCINKILHFLTAGVG